MVVFITMNLEGLWNFFRGENPIDCPGLHFTGLHCTWFTGEHLILNNKLVAGTSIRRLDPSFIMKFYYAAML